MAARDHRQGTALALVSEPTARSPERQALADALDLLAERQRGLENCRAAIRAAEAMEAEAAGALHVAQSDLKQAKEDRAAEITAAAAAGAAVPSSDRQRLARQRVGEAEDELEAVRQSVASVRVPLEDWEYWAEHAADGVRTAVADVAATMLPDAISAVMTAIKNAETCMRTAHLIYRASVDRRQGGPADDARRQCINEAQGLGNAGGPSRTTAAAPPRIGCAHSTACAPIRMRPSRGSRPSRTCCPASPAPAPQCADEMPRVRQSSRGRLGLVSVVSAVAIAVRRKPSSGAPEITDGRRVRVIPVRCPARNSSRRTPCREH